MLRWNIFAMRPPVTGGGVEGSAMRSLSPIGSRSVSSVPFFHGASPSAFVPTVASCYRTALPLPELAGKLTNTSSCGNRRPCPRRHLQRAVGRRASVPPTCRLTRRSSGRAGTCLLLGDRQRGAPLNFIVRWQHDDPRRVQQGGDMSGFKRGSRITCVLCLAVLALAGTASPTMAQTAERPVVKAGDRWQFVEYYGIASTGPNRDWVVTSVTSSRIEGT